MTRYGKLLLASVVLCAVLGIANAEKRHVITKDALVEMFDGMAANTSWDLTGPLLWGYFFIDESKEKLEFVAPLLASQGYRVVEIYLSDKDEPDDPDTWWLHVERVEHHTADTLHERNLALYQFADEHDLGSYDGMDVGPVEASP